MNKIKLLNELIKDEKKINNCINLYKKIKHFKSSKTHRNLIFIVGMPRSGSSLIEQILSSHKNVFGGGEIPYMQEIANKIINEKKAYISIILGLIFGFLLFPTPDFSKSLLVGIIVPTEFFSSFFVQNLLFWSFIAATLGPMISWKIK